MKFVVYSTDEGGREVLVTTLKKEDAFLKEFFGNDLGRNVEDYSRAEVFGSTGVLVQINTSVRVG